MMSWYGHGFGAWGWIAMTLGMMAFWALVATALVWLLRTVPRAGESREPGMAKRTAEQLLADRFARGEIDESEYRDRLSVLQSMTGPAAKR